MSSPYDQGLETSLRFGFRRRCGWCGVVLRAWQLNLCRGCRLAASDLAPLPFLSSPPCPSGSRWKAAPDPWRWHAPSD